jgi:hypothetical protein
MLTHGGGIHGFVSVLDYLPQSRTTVVILRNSDAPGLNLDLVARKLAAFAVGEPFAEAKAVAVPAEQLNSVEGVYAREDQQSRMLRVKDGVLHSQRSSGASTALIALGGDRFAFPDSLTEMQIERGADGRPVAARVFNNGEKDDSERWVRSGELPPELAFITLSPAQMQALVGDYVSPQFAVRVFIDDQGRLQGQAPGQPAFELKASTPRRVHVPQVDAQLDFSDEADQPASVTLIQGGSKLVMARR